MKIQTSATTRGFLSGVLAVIACLALVLAQSAFSATRGTRAPIAPIAPGPTSGTHCYSSGDCVTITQDTAQRWLQSAGSYHSSQELLNAIATTAKNEGTLGSVKTNSAGLLTSVACINGVSATIVDNQPPPPPPPSPPPPPPTSPTCSITFDKNPISSGEKTKIHWSSTRAALFYINTIGYVGGSGSVSVSPSGTTDYSGSVNDKADGSGTSARCPATLVVSGGMCAEGEILRGRDCVSQCPVGYTYQNGSCVFSACPSGYVKRDNKCVRSTECTTPPRCDGNDLVNSCTGDTISTCDWGCAAGACKAAPAPSATLKAVPLLVHSGGTTSVSWSAFKVASCTVRGTNGDSWTGKASDGKTSSAISGQTIYTLHCNGYAGANPPSIDKSVIVNIVPTFNEK
jgi:hypothetical protein